jgi:hypothetical protein
LLHLRPASLFRPPDWRYHWARALLQSPDRRQATNERDEDVLGIRDLLRLLGSGEADRQPLPDRLAPYRAALELDAGRDELLRSVVESHILARQPLEHVATATGLAIDGVRAYEAIFFNVLDRLEDTGYIRVFVLQAGRPPKLNLGFVLRNTAYETGPVALDDLLWYFGLGRFALSPRFRPPEHVEDDLWRRAVIAGMLLPADPRPVRALAELQVRYDRLDQLKADPHRYHEALVRTRVAQIKRLRRAFGAAAIREHAFLGRLLDP